MFAMKRMQLYQAQEFEKAAALRDTEQKIKEELEAYKEIMERKTRKRRV